MNPWACGSAEAQVLPGRARASQTRAARQPGQSTGDRDTSSTVPHLTSPSLAQQATPGWPAILDCSTVHGPQELGLLGKRHPGWPQNKWGTAKSSALSHPLGVGPAGRGRVPGPVLSTETTRWCCRARFFQKVIQLVSGAVWVRTQPCLTPR